MDKRKACEEMPDAELEELSAQSGLVQAQNIQGRAGRKMGRGVKKAESPESDRGDREKKQQSSSAKDPQDLRFP
jgi:hypothetical protein